MRPRSPWSDGLIICVAFKAQQVNAVGPMVLPSKCVPLSVSKPPAGTRMLLPSTQAPLSCFWHASGTPANGFGVPTLKQHREGRVPSKTRHTPNIGGAHMSITLNKTPI